MIMPTTGSLGSAHREPAFPRSRPGDEGSPLGAGEEQVSALTGHADTVVRDEHRRVGGHRSRRRPRGRPIRRG
jgi:hypothetical protein